MRYVGGGCCRRRPAVLVGHLHRYVVSRRGRIGMAGRGGSAGGAVAEIPQVGEPGSRVGGARAGDRRRKRDRRAGRAGIRAVGVHRGRHVVDPDRCRGAGLGCILVDNGHRDQVTAVGLAGRVVIVLVADARERQGAGRQVDHRVGRAVCPDNRDLMRIERARVGEAAAELDRTALVDRCGSGGQADTGRSNVVDLDRGGAAALAAVLVGDGRGDREAARGLAVWVIQVLVAGPGEAEDASRQVER